MVNFRKVNDNDILKEWLDYREIKNIIFILMRFLKIF